MFNIYILIYLYLYSKYRPQGSTSLAMVTGQRGDGCTVCPRGRYGATTGLTLSTCTSSCPLGTYGGNTGLKSAAQCTPCSRGKYSSVSGIKSDSDCNYCPSGKYGSTFGLSNSGQCTTCPHGYPGWQCSWPLYNYAPKTTH